MDNSPKYNEEVISTFQYEYLDKTFKLLDEKSNQYGQMLQINCVILQPDGKIDGYITNDFEYILDKFKRWNTMYIFINDHNIKMR